MAPRKKAKKPKTKSVPLDEAQLAELRAQQALLAKNELRRRLEDEAKISKINSLKIMNQWRKIMRLAKTESLKKEIEILSQNHERDVDRKDAILQMLDRDLDEAEDQYQMALRTHLMNVDTLIKLHDSRLYALERNFQQELRTIQSDWIHEKEHMIQRFTQEKNELRAILETIEAEEEGRNNEIKHTYEQLREEIRNRSLEEINSLRISLDGLIEDLEQHFERAHLNYLQQTSQRTHDFKELTQNDQKLTAEIEKRRKKIENLQTTIQHWRAKMRQLTRETEERNRLLLEEKLAIQKHYQQLKQRIKVYRTTQNQRLLQLSQSANACKKVLQDKLDVARSVLALNELSRRMETVSEQVLPFTSVDQADTEVVYKDSMEATFAAEESGGKKGATQDILTNSSGPVPHQTMVLSPDGEQRFVPYSDRLALFYKKYNKVLLDNLAIQRERDRLTLENAQLSDLIQQYLDGTRISDEVLAGDNPLFVVNGRANLNQQLPVRHSKPQVQDAVQITASVARQTMRS